ncbi:MAG: hypothetical protein ACI8UR_001474 [Natronomonas sp.]|jgi:hypothetical protein|uniref:hypothetical protein n=1 Tax=Natronomonas sp. TaxID=2184060 RepID=UPI003989ED74
MARAETPSERRQLLVESVVAHRKGGDEAIVFEGVDRPVEYDDQRLRLELDADERDRLDSLLSEYHVFKIKQPETRKADDGVVYLSAVTDPKHAADFIEALFRDVYAAAKTYELRVRDT